jgi:hypothetical protein
VVAEKTGKSLLFPFQTWGEALLIASGVLLAILSFLLMPYPSRTTIIQLLQRDIVVTLAFKSCAKIQGCQLWPAALRKISMISITAASWLTV